MEKDTQTNSNPFRLPLKRSNRAELRGADELDSRLRGNDGLVLVLGFAPFLAGLDGLFKILGGHTYEQLRMPLVVHMGMQADGVHACPQQLLAQRHS